MNPTNRRKLFVDVLLFLGASALFAHQATGDAAHEWFGVALFALLFWHLLLNWDWIVSGVRKIFGRLPGIVRFNFVWDVVLYFLFVGATLSGALISRTFLATFGVSIENDGFMSALHRWLAAALVVAFGVHLGVHYRWILSVLRRGDAEKRAETVEEPETVGAAVSSEGKEPVR